MPQSPLVGTAYVSIRADTSGLARSIRERLTRELASAGDDAGGAFSERFERSVNRLSSRLRDRFRASGERSGEAFAAGFGANALPNVSTSFRALADRAGDGGRESGRAFGEGFGDGFNLNLGPFNRSFSSLTQAILRLGPIVTIAVQALAGLGAQLSALVSALSSAASASALFIPLITSIGTAAVVTAIGFQGFIDGVREGGEALAGLQPSARAAAEALRGLRDEFSQIQDVVQQRLFVDLAQPLRELANTILPVVQQQFANTASVINGFLVSFTRFAQSQRNVQDLNTVLQSQNVILVNLLASIQPLVAAFRDWLVPMLPLAERLSTAIQRGAERLANFAAQGRATGATADFFARAYENAALLLSGIRDLTVGIVNFFSAGREEGNSMLATFAELAARFREFATSVEGQQAFQQVFEFGAIVVQRLASALQIVVNILSPLVSAFSQVAGAAAPLLDTFVALSETIGQGLTIVLQPLIAGWTQLITTFTQAANEVLPLVQLSINGLAQGFSSLLTAVIPLILQVQEQLIPAVLSLLPPIIQLGTQIIQALMPAVTTLFQAFAQIVPIIVDAVVPVIRQLIVIVGEVVVALAPLIADLVQALAPILVRVAQLFAAMLPAIVPVAQFIANVLIADIQQAVSWITFLANAINTAIDWFVRWLDPIRAAAQVLAGYFMDSVRTVTNGVRGFFGAISDAISWLGNFLQPIRNVAAAFTSGFLGVVRDAAGLVGDVAGSIQNAINWFRDFLDPIRSAADAFGPFSGAVEGALGVIDNIAGAVSGAIGAIQRLIDAIGRIPDPSSIVAGFEGLPSLPGLPFATGGLVAGPTRALVGEAGREAIIPLDRPLSQVDPSVREMAALLRGQQSFASGGVAGGGRSVTVLPGAIQVTTQVANPALVAESVVDRLAVEAAIG